MILHRINKIFPASIEKPSSNIIEKKISLGDVKE